MGGEKVQGRSEDPDREGKGMGKESEMGRGQGRSVDPDKEGKGVGKECGPRQRREGVWTQTEKGRSEDPDREGEGKE